MTDEEIKQLIASNAKAIEALTNALSKEREERITDKNQFQQTIAVGRLTDSHSADIRELIIENQRILRYLETLINRTSNNL
ncbi:hypothetical protein [Gloeocapsa sp. PCC 73106]|uniref:hypothetical protein n=1 Tax=Gloeocapsa sp. PCC 73106 TaxID=102232 RepID=UPI0002AD1349|nr:hypothetical protein [Gloeocapsa sp. PCC 73106]ELR97055.1 hypothetical protein GLO73106DRAFT_00008580 [Gloeocapsa sp. PCC 73106]